MRSFPLIHLPFLCIGTKIISIRDRRFPFPYIVKRTNKVDGCFFAGK